MVLITLGFGLSANAQTFAKPLKDVPFSVSVNSITTTGKAEVTIAYLPDSKLVPPDFHASLVAWNFPAVAPPCSELSSPECASLPPAERIKPTIIMLWKQGQQLTWTFPAGGRYIIHVIVQDAHGNARNYTVVFQVNKPVEWLETDPRVR